MLIFQKYLLRNLLGSCFFVTSILVGVVWITQTLRFVETVFRKVDTNALIILLKLSLYMLPNLIVILLPVGLAIGSLFSIYKFLEDREIVSLWAGGVSTKKMINLAFILGMGAFILSFFLQAIVSPLFMNRFRQLDRSVRQNVTLSFIETNAFQDFGDITLYVRSKKRNNLFDIVAYMEPQKGNPYTIIAKKGAIIKDGKVPRLVLEDGIRQEKKPEDAGRISMLHFDRSIVEVATSSGDNLDAYKKPSEYFLWELFSPKKEVLENEMLARKIRAEVHQRFMTPYLSFLFPILVSFLLLTTGFQRRGYVKRSIITMGSVLGLQAFTLISASSNIEVLSYFTYFFLVSITGIIFYKIYNSGVKVK